MISPASFWPSALGLGFLAAGLWTYRRDLLAESSALSRVVSLGPVFVAAALATFAGEHFTAAKALSVFVPKWMPARLFITYFVGVAHLSAALSFVARRCIRWSAFFLALMFALFVLLLWLPSAISHPAIRITWIVTVRETTFSMGALALFATAVRDRLTGLSRRLAGIARAWTGMVLIFFGIQNILFPQYSPGVPDTQPTASWVPGPHAIAYMTGILLVVFGIAMFVNKYAGSGGTFAGLLMLLLTLALYVPQFFLAQNATEEVTAINFVFDTLLFAGTLFVITKAILDSQSKPMAICKTAIKSPR